MNALFSSSVSESIAWLSKDILFASFILLLLVIVVVLAAFNVRMRQRIKRELEGEADSASTNTSPETLALTRQQLFREISRHENTEQLLRETQHYMQSVINSMPSILIGVTADGVITHWNLAATKATHMHADEALGANIRNVFPELPMIPKLISSAISEGTAFKRENIQQGSGSAKTFVELVVYPLTMHDISGAVVMIEDVSKQTRIESMMIHSEKMMSLGEMAAGLAHEINNPLAGILNSTQNIERRTLESLPANEKTAQELGLDLEKMQRYLRERGIIEFLQTIRTSGEQAAQIVKNMLEFSRSNYQSQVPYDIRVLIDESLELVRKSLELRTAMGVEMPNVRVVIGDDVPLVPCSSTEMKQVLVNLVRNAAQAFQSDEYGPPLDPLVLIEVSRADDKIHIDISDNGPGMPESIRRHIFEPFFTTKDTGKGTGLGLSVTYFIITEHHNGSIDVTSSPGDGTTFSITLPLAA